MLPFPVKVKIKFRDLSDKFSGLFIQTTDIFQKSRSENDLSCHIKTDHVDHFSILVKGVIDQCGSIRIAPVVILCNRGTVSVAFKRTAHRYQFLDLVKSCRGFLDQACKICHGTQGDHGDFFFYQRLGEKIYSTDFLLISGDLGQKAFAEPVSAMSIQSVYVIPLQRSGFPNIDRHIQPVHLLQDLFCVFESHFHGGISADNGDSKYFDFR